MDIEQASSEFITAASDAVDAMVKPENSLLTFGDVEAANVLSAARVKLENAGRAFSTGQDENSPV